jgi:hypothetical protein
MLGRSLSCVRATYRAWSLICWSLEWTSPVDELWKHLNPPSADYIESNVLKTKALQKTVPAGQAVATFKPKTRR